MIRCVRVRELWPCSSYVLLLYPASVVCFVRVFGRFWGARVASHDLLVVVAVVVVIFLKT